MRKLISILLPVAGLLYPFVVYFGTEKVSPPVFALVLGAIWLVRAPSLLKQRGGAWMVAAALAYCVLLAITGEAQLLRWYPVLISALLLAAFGLSLIYGPPFIERIARLREPNLPPAAVRYTRVVTWVWMVFFAFNGSMSLALSLWAPLRWWTLYNGLIAYLIMGALFVVEWLLRQRLRLKISSGIFRKQADALHRNLASHAWVAEVHVGSTGALLLLNPSGLGQLRQYGRQSLLDQLHAHLLAHAIEPVPLRLLDRASDELNASTVDRLLQSPRPDHALPLGEHAQDGRWTLTLQLPLELIHFDDHFANAPVLPGVLQVGWALALAAPRLGTSMHCREMEALKFQRLLRPGDRVALSLHLQDDAQDSASGKLHFAYHVDGAHCSSGRLKVERA